jgi:hypothetical protein
MTLTDYFITAMWFVISFVATLATLYTIFGNP